MAGSAWCARVLLLVPVVFGAACGEGFEARSEERDPEHVLLLRIEEVSTDDFGDELPQVEGIESDAPPWRVEGDRVLLTSSAPAVADGDLLVVWTTSLEGRGRTGGRTSWQVVSGAGGTIPLAALPSGDTWEHRPGEDDVPFVLAVRDLRVLPKGFTGLRLSREDDDLVLVARNTRWRFAAGESSELAAAERTVRILEGGISTSDVDWLDGPPEGLDFEVSESRDHGPVALSTRLVASYEGLFALVRGTRGR